ncbi:DUF2723 domain-containing protein [Candidatus Leptofilum sp.]|uniref:glycosyltransferase family 117 protein n=1 Tax=Candidatus Leptofilum sp. TaxID=3241576 RepID=UPI003B5D001F
MQNGLQRWESWGTAVLTFLVYFLTMPRDLTWQFSSGDGGELITAAVTLGIPHPPGYPTYVLLGKLWSFLPLEPVAYSFHIFSALCAAGAAGLVTVTAKKQLSTIESNSSGWLGIVPGLLFAFSSLVWQQAVVAEVYALNLLAVAAFLWALLGKRPSHLTGLLLGLSFTTHLTSLFLLPLALLLTPTKAWGQLAVGLAIGASPYLLLPLLADQGSPVIWGNPTTLTGWWWLVSGELYQPNQFALPLTEFWARLGSWLPRFGLQLGILGWGILVWYGRSLRQIKWLGLVGTAVLYLIYAIFYNTQDAIVLTLPAWLIFSLCLTVALPRTGKWSAILPGLAVLLHLSGQTGANIHNVRAQAEAILNAAPPDAILVTAGDPDIFALWYFHHVEDNREDIILVDNMLFAFDWYRQAVQRHHPTLRALEEDNLTRFETVNGLNRPICRVRLLPEGEADPQLDCSRAIIE